MRKWFKKWLAHGLLPPSPNNASGQNAQQVSAQPQQYRITDLEDRIRKAEKLMIWLTAAIAFFALCSVFVAFLQFFDGEKQTAKLIEAADKQAAAATSFAGTAAEIDGEIDRAEQDFRTMAGSSEASVAAIRDTARQEQRAWVSATVQNYPDQGIPKGDDVFDARVIFTNTGRTPASDTRTCGRLAIMDAGKEPDFKCSATVMPVDTISPGGRIFSDLIPGKLAPDMRDRILSNKSVVWVYGFSEYNDVFGIKHRTDFCNRLLSGGAYALCGRNNTMK